MNQNPIIVALDVPDLSLAQRLAEQTAPYVGALKIGKELFVSEGPAAVRAIAETGRAVFLDLKFHDIPNTVARAVTAAVRLGVQMLTLHCSGGPAMLRAARESAHETARQIDAQPPLLLGVTVLTSLDAEDLRAIGVQDSVEAQVLRLARLAAEAGLDGLVCSPKELPVLRPAFPSLQLVTPGIRPRTESTPPSHPASVTNTTPPEDQKRTLTPTEAIQNGADWIVVGRPITAAPDPATAAQKIWEEVQAARKKT